MFSLRRLPIYRQAEAAECGIACIGMVAAWHGKEFDMPALRRRYPVSMQGASLNDLIRVAKELGLGSRALRLELNGLKKIALPAILHWDFNHFVVLAEVRRNGVVIHDPAAGIREVGISELSRAFTGVALELRPAPDFTRRREVSQIRLWDIFGQVKGLGTPLLQILAFSLMIQVFAIVAPFLTQMAIDHVVPAGDLQLLRSLALGFGAIYLLRPIVEWLRTRLTIFVATQFSAQLTANLFRYLLSLPLTYFEKRSIGDLLTRFDASDRLRELLTQGFITVFVDALLGIATLAMMFYYSMWMGLVVLITAIIVVAIRMGFVPRLRMLVNETLQRKGREQGEMIESMRGIASIKFAQREMEREAIWNNAFAGYITAAADLEATQANYTVMRDIVQQVSLVLLIYMGIRFVIDGDSAFTLGAFFAFAAYRDMFFERLASFVDQLVQFSMSRVHLERLSEIISTDPEKEPSEYFVYNDGKLQLDLRDVGYSFGGEGKTVLDKVNLSITRGDRIVMFGPSGTGKSTLLKVLAGVYPAEEGVVQLNGVDVRQAGLRYLRSSVAAVLQDDYLFRGSIIDNITFFDREPDFERAMDCARMAAVHDEIMSLPMSYESLIGEMGTALSQGQQQRVLLARALYQDKPLLILDEGTAHLDEEREAEVLENLAKSDLTIVMTAHKASLRSFGTTTWTIDRVGHVRTEKVAERS